MVSSVARRIIRSSILFGICFFGQQLLQSQWLGILIFHRSLSLGFFFLSAHFYQTALPVTVVLVSLDRLGRRGLSELAPALLLRAHRRATRPGRLRPAAGPRSRSRFFRLRRGRMLLSNAQVRIAQEGVGVWWHEWWYGRVVGRVARRHVQVLVSGIWPGEHVSLEDRSEERV